MTPYLTDIEINCICAPLTAPSAQIRYFQKLGMLVHRKPGGKALVARAEFDRVLVGGMAAKKADSGREPDRSALLSLFKGKYHGP